MFQWDDQKGAPASTLGHNGHEFGVDRTEVVVVDVLGDGDAVKAVLSVGHFAVDVSKLGAAILRPP